MCVCVCVCWFLVVGLFNCNRTQIALRAQVSFVYLLFNCSTNWLPFLSFSIDFSNNSALSLRFFFSSGKLVVSQRKQLKRKSMWKSRARKCHTQENDRNRIIWNSSRKSRPLHLKVFYPNPQPHTIRTFLLSFPRIEVLLAFETTNVSARLSKWISYVYLHTFNHFPPNLYTKFERTFRQLIIYS